MNAALDDEAHRESESASGCINEYIYIFRIHKQVKKKTLSLFTVRSLSCFDHYQSPLNDDLESFCL